MVLDIDESDQDKILELLTISRVNDFTLSNFMINLWFNSIGALVMFSLFFCCCRLYRNDKERFIQKLHKMQPTSAVDSDDDEYDQGLKLMHLDASLMTSRVNADEQMDVENNNLLRVNVANMNPLSIVQIIDDLTMIRMFGRDRFLYLKFLKYQSWFFLALFVLGWTILMPTYNSGQDAKQYIESNAVEGAGESGDGAVEINDGITLKAGELDEINLLEFTILNVVNEDAKLLVAYSFTVITTIVMYISIYCFWRGTRTWFDFSGKHEKDDMGYSQLNKHCLLLKGIPKHMSTKEATRHIKRMLNKVDGLHKDKVYDVKVVEEFDEFFNLKQELQNLNKQIALSMRYEQMLAQMERFEEKPPDEKDQFLGQLDEQELTKVPFYRLCPNYFDVHRREVKFLGEYIKF